MNSERFAIALMIDFGASMPLVDTSVRVHDQHSLDVVHTLIEARCFGHVGRGRFVFAVTQNGHTARHTFSVYVQSAPGKKYHPRFRTFKGLELSVNTFFHLRGKLDETGLSQSPWSDRLSESITKQLFPPLL